MYYYILYEVGVLVSSLYKAHEMCIVSIHERGGVNVKCVCVHDYTVYWCVCTTQGVFSCSVIDIPYD